MTSPIRTKAEQKRMLQRRSQGPGPSGGPKLYQKLENAQAAKARANKPGPGSPTKPPAKKKPTPRTSYPKRMI